MDEKMWRYGCLFCRTGAEATIVGYINQTITDVEAVAPTRTRRKTVAGKVIEDQVQLTRITNVLKLLEYDNLSWELTGGDRQFAEFLFDNDLLQPLHVSFIDGKLHFEDGFLYGHDDAVLRVNRRKKTAEIRLVIDRLAFWISYTERQ